MKRTAVYAVLLALAAITLMLLVARAYDYEQSAAKVKPRIGTALVCVGRYPGPILCSSRGAREVRWQWIIDGQVL